MFKLMSFTLPENPAPEECFLDLVLQALKVRGWVPDETPDFGLGNYYVRMNLDALTVERMSGGWVSNIIFKRRDGERADCMTSSLRDVFPSAAEALVFGASVVCEIVTGSPELPFGVAGNRLIMTSYGRTPEPIG